MPNKFKKFDKYIKEVKGVKAYYFTAEKYWKDVFNCIKYTLKETVKPQYNNQRGFLNGLPVIIEYKDN